MDNATTTMSDRIHDVSFRLDRDQTKKHVCLNVEQEADKLATKAGTDCLHTTQDTNPRKRWDRLTRRKGI